MAHDQSEPLGEGVEFSAEVADHSSITACKLRTGAYVCKALTA